MLALWTASARSLWYIKTLQAQVILPNVSGGFNRWFKTGFPPQQISMFY